MKTLKVNLLVTVEVECTEPESFSNFTEFAKQDGVDMVIYLKEKIGESLTGSYNYAAKVSKFKIKTL